MASDLTIGDFTFSQLSNAPKKGTDASGYNTGIYWMDYNIGTKQFDDRLISLPGVDGFYVKRYGNRGRGISVQVCCIDADLFITTECLYDIEDTLTAITPFQIMTPGGIIFHNCTIQNPTEKRMTKILSGGLFYSEFTANYFYLGY